MTNVYDVLQERGFIEQLTHEEEIKKLLAEKSVTFYIGFDPTADSLHVGHFLQIMVMMHMQRAGHKPIALIGGGTALVGDPTGKTDMRKMLTAEEIEKNAAGIAKQIAKYIDVEDGHGYIVNNATWLRELNYVNFLREIGKHFSVNKMLTADCFKTRLEKGLSFLEFNYMLMQSYDFLELFKQYNCQVQFGGNDQWSNILGGIDLIRRKVSQTVFGLTFKLLTTSEGKKMGKTEAGAIWINPEKTSPYDLYQYLRNVDDADVKTLLSLLTFLPMEEVKRLSSLKDAAINQAKEILAFEFTKIVHGKEEAKKAQEAAKALFDKTQLNAQSIPTKELPTTEFTNSGMGILNLLKKVGLTSSNSEALRLIKNGGIYLNNQRVEDPKMQITLENFTDNSLMLRKGKKGYCRVTLS